MSMAARGEARRGEEGVLVGGGSGEGRGEGGKGVTLGIASALQVAVFNYVIFVDGEGDVGIERGRFQIPGKLVFYRRLKPCVEVVD